jgi:hypothetical protein
LPHTRADVEPFSSDRLGQFAPITALIAEKGLHVFRVVSDSVEQAGVAFDDVVLLNKRSEPKTGDIVLVSLDERSEQGRRQGPWQGQHRGELANLNTQYLLDIEEQGYSLVRCELAVFKPEM